MPPAPGQHADLDLRHSEGGAGGQHPQIAGDRELAAATERGAVDGGDRGLGQLVDAVVDALDLPDEAEELLGTVELGDLRDVGPSRERPAFTGEDHRRDRRVGREQIAGVVEILNRLAADRVEPVRPVESDHAGGSAPVHDQLENEVREPSTSSPMGGEVSGGSRRPARQDEPGSRRGEPAISHRRPRLLACPSGWRETRVASSRGSPWHPRARRRRRSSSSRRPTRPRRSGLPSGASG